GMLRTISTAQRPATERAGEVIKLNETARLPYLGELIERKTGGPEKGRLDQADLVFHQQEYERLRALLQQAFEKSRLPDRPRAGAALHDVLVRLRLKQQSVSES